MNEAFPGLGWGHNLNITPATLLSKLQQLWQLPWDNSRKEIYWRLVMDALPTAERMHMAGEPCNCGVLMPGRAHHYWDCPVAAAVTAEVQRALHLFDPATRTVQRHHLWLFMVPQTQLHKGVWMVVCLAALLSMDKGRKCLVRWRLHGSQGGRPGQRPPPPCHSASPWPSALL